MEQENQTMNFTQLSQQELQKLQRQLQHNKKQMIKILKQSPQVGVYQGEDPQIFQNIFFPFYMHFLKLQIGPRGQCSRAVRQQLSLKPEFYNQILKPLGMFFDSHIRDIFVKYKIYSPCKEYEQLIKLKQSLIKAKDSFQKILDINSIMYKKIKQGMLAKRGQQYQYEPQIQKIQLNYKQKIQGLQKKQKQLQQFLNNNQTYLDYIRLKQQMDQYFTKWKQADIRIGHQSCTKGNDFQNKVVRDIMPVIFKRINFVYHPNRYQVLTNCTWQPRSLGQIDIAIAKFNQDARQWEVTVLIECKSRLFDIRQAYKQVTLLNGPNFKKQKLGTKLGILKVIDNPQHFIVTTLPENPFNLPIQSKMKQALERGSKNKTLQEIDRKQLFQYVKQKFQKQASPLQWMKKYDSDRIIVLNHQNQIN